MSLNPQKKRPNETDCSVHSPLPRKVLRYHQSLAKVRKLKVCDVEAIIKGSESLRGKVNILGPLEFIHSPLLKEGQGYILVCISDGGPHAVSLFRTLGGKFLYYDSFSYEPTPLLKPYLKMHKVSTYLMSCCRMQHCGIQTCAYHALAFLRFAIESTIEDPKELMTSYTTQVRETTEGFAVGSVLRLLSENNIDVNIFMDPEKHSSDDCVLYSLNQNDSAPEKGVKLAKRIVWCERFRNKTWAVQGSSGS